MEVRVAKKRFNCPHCGENSKLPDPCPQEGLFKISCALCQNQSLIRFQGGNYFVEKKLPATKPIKYKSKPFFEKQVKKESNVDQNSKDTTNHFALPTFFRSLKDRIQDKDFSKPKDKPGRNKVSNSTERKKYLSLLYWSGLAILLFSITVLAFLGTGVLRTKSELSDIIGNLSKGKPTKIIDRNGQVVSEIFQKRISTLKLEDYPENLITALLNVEDRGFYSHGGIDLTALFRAIVKNIIHLRYKQGASTITQQLARILLDDRTKSLGRKWKELELAFALESNLSKDQILEYYMNNVYLGHGAYGFGEAIKFYFNKNPSEINKSEAILLATLPSAPNRNSPLRNPSQSRERLEYIMIAFKNRGVLKDIPHDEISDIYSRFSTRSPNETVFGNRQDLAPYVTEHIRSFLKSIGEGDSIYDEGGYTVETTLIKDIQKNVGNIVHNHLQGVIRSGQVRKTVLRRSAVVDSKEEIAIKSLLKEASLAMELFSSSEWEEESSTTPNGLQAAVIALDPKTGEILFMHGGDEFKAQNQFNRAIQMRRQTGSSIKPILYASAINSGIITNADKILDAPLIYRGVQGLPNWTPDNLGKKYDGEISLRYALAQSKNTAAVQIAEKLGYSQLDHYFGSFFFPDSAEKNKRFRNDLSLALGSLEISPLEMASAFSSFSNEGKIQKPYLIKKITNQSGEVIFERGNHDEFDLKIPNERSVIKPDTAEVVLSLLKDSGKSSGIYRSGYKGLVAGKTGTTNDNKDAWFIGNRPGITMAIWVGFDDPRLGMGPGGLGGRVAAPLWGEIMKKADSEKLMEIQEFPKPVFAISAPVCGSRKIQCPDCTAPNHEWFTIDHVKPDNCNEYSKEIEDKREMLQELF
ncbi:MAG: transglycosylase domain-containing protein [Leptospira sp.]|nr:transglycosylase domain-containing protein [Leptospira sp.]